MSFPGSIYSPAGVYTRTLYENPSQGLLAGLRLPIYVGTGSEALVQEDLEIVRGSSSTVDQRIVQEDEDGRAVSSISGAGVITLGDFDGVLDRIQVRNYPIVTGNGTGTTATNTSAVSVTINDDPIVVLSIDGTTGVLKLATPPEAGDTVRATYYFNRTDTRVTDDVSDQISATAPTLYGAVGETYEIITGTNDTLIFTVDDASTETTITINASAAGSPWTASQLASFINAGAVGTTLVASTFINNHGQTAIQLTASRNIAVGNGTANSTVGFTNGDATARNAVFYVFNGPIVDGTNGGITTTDPGDVTVRVDNVAVTPTSVDGQTRAVTLPFSPEVGATVTIQYYFNTWQDTFDYLAHINVTEVYRCGASPDRSDYVEEADFILQDDRIMWGTAVVVSGGTHTSGTTIFDDTQVTGTLVDTRQYLAACTAYTDGSVSPPVTSSTVFTLPLVPTTGNGRNSPLGSSLYQTVANSRIDLPTNRPDLVTAYWGYGVQDAIERGAVTVKSVDSSTSRITLASAVPVGASVYATFYYNTLTDQEYTVAVETAGAAGVGTYSITNEAGTNLMTPRFGTKAAALAGITLQFPSGSERTPDCRFESPFTTTSFVGPVEEDVTVTFNAFDSTLAKFTVPDAGPYYSIEDGSDHARIQVDGADIVSGAAGVDLSNVTGVDGLGFHAQLISDEIPYAADAAAPGAAYDITVADNEVNLTVDGVLLPAKAEIAADVTVASFVTAINRAATGVTGTAAAGGVGTITLAVGESAIDDIYNGWVIVITAGMGAGTSTTISDYVGSTRVATTAAGTFDGTSVYFIYNADQLASYKAATPFASSVTIAASKYDNLSFHYTGDVGGASGNIRGVVAPATYTSANTLATAVQTAMRTGITAAGALFNVVVEADANAQLVVKLIRDPQDAAGYLEFITQTTLQASGTATVDANPIGVGETLTIGGTALTSVAGARTPGNDDFDGSLATPTLIAADIQAAINDPANSFAAIAVALSVGPIVNLTAVPVGALGNAVTLATNSADITLSGATLTGGSTAGDNDFCILAGWDTAAAANGAQTKLVDGPIARRFTITGDSTGAFNNDRLILRNRVIPGSGSLDSSVAVAQGTLEVEGSSGSTLAGLTVNDLVTAGWKGTVQTASLVGHVGFSDGQVATGTYSDGRDGQPVVTFFQTGGTTAQNNQLSFSLDDIPVSFEFTDAAGTAIASGATADVPLGPVGTANTVLNQMAVAMASAGLAANAAAVIAAGYLRQEGDGIRLRSILSTSASSIVMGSANGTTRLGFTASGAASRTAVQPDVMASALMGHAGATVPATLLTTWVTGPTATYFAAEALARQVEDASNAEYLYLQSTGTSGAGTTSSLAWAAATTDDVMRQGAGLGLAAGDGSAGEAGISGYTVTSTDLVNGSGTANTSVFNSGVGQDGIIGQTYRDLVTGLTFTILAREGGANYPAASTFTFTVRQVATTDSNLPSNAIPGIELLVTNTLGVGVGDTALAETYERGGNEPAVGDLYYASYYYTKQDFTTKLFTKFSAVVAEYGDNTPSNPVVLASYLAILNGAVVVGVKQVQKDTDDDADGTYDSASLTAFTTAIDELEGPLTGGTLPDVLVPLDYPSASTTTLLEYLARHCDIQSTIRRRAERTAIAGFPAGTVPRTAGDIASAVSRYRLRVVYPDMVTLSLDTADGTTEDYLVDGSYLASAMAGAVMAPSVDVATPWTGRKLFGFTQLGRTLDAVEQNQTAVRGVTIIEDYNTVLKVRQGFTTQMDSILTKLPTIVQIADEVQQQARGTLERFVGIKFLPGVLSQIEGQLSNTLKLLVAAEILAAYTGVAAQTAPDDPTVAEVEAYYAPVFPLLYIVCTFNLRSSL